MNPRLAFVLPFAALVASGCSAATPQEQVLTVAAASSLTDAFTELGAQFEEEHPEVTVRFTFAGSSTLAAQVTAGAPIDVLATASRSTMQVAVDAGDIVGPSVFATNYLEIAVPAGNPAGITGLADLADPDVTVVMCAPEVPCGAAAKKMLESSGIALTPVSLEPDVRAVLAKIVADEADAGIVYRSDVTTGGDRIDGITIPDDQNATTEYVIGPTTTATDRAQEFIDLVLSPSGQEVLQQSGLGPA